MPAHQHQLATFAPPLRGMRLHAERAAHVAQRSRSWEAPQIAQVNKHNKRYVAY